MCTAHNYTIGKSKRSRVDNKPEELFLLRQADHIELIAVAGTASISKTTADHSDEVLSDTDLSSLFGIEMGGVEEKTAIKKNRVTEKPIKIKKTIKKKTLPAVKKTTKKVKAKTKKVSKIAVSKKVKGAVKSKNIAVKKSVKRKAMKK